MKAFITTLALDLLVLMCFPVNMKLAQKFIVDTIGVGRGMSMGSPGSPQHILATSLVLGGVSHMRHI